MIWIYIEIPDNLIVGGDLDLLRSGVTELPAGLTVDGYLDLNGTEVTSLPAGLVVGKFLDLRGTEITSLPDGLVVGGNLNLHGTKVTELPAGLSVGMLYAYDGQLIASESVQLEWVGKGADMLRVFKAPTEKASRLHEMMWEI